MRKNETNTAITTCTLTIALFCFVYLDKSYNILFFLFCSSSLSSSWVIHFICMYHN